MHIFQILGEGTSLEKAASADDVDFFMDGFDEGNDNLDGGAGDDFLNGRDGVVGNDALDGGDGDTDSCISDPDLETNCELD
jgi:hypothetical protein